MAALDGVGRFEQRRVGVVVRGSVVTAMIARVGLRRYTEGETKPWAAGVCAGPQVDAEPPARRPCQKL